MYNRHFCSLIVFHYFRCANSLRLFFYTLRYVVCLFHVKIETNMGKLILEKTDEDQVAYHVITSQVKKLLVIVPRYHVLMRKPGLYNSNNCLRTSERGY